MAEDYNKILKMIIDPTGRKVKSLSGDTIKQNTSDSVIQLISFGREFNIMKINYKISPSETKSNMMVSRGRYIPTEKEVTDYPELVNADHIELWEVNVYKVITSIIRSGTRALEVSFQGYYDIDNKNISVGNTKINVTAADEGDVYLSYETEDIDALWEDNREIKYSLEETNTTVSELTDEFSEYQDTMASIVEGINSNISSHSDSIDSLNDRLDEAESDIDSVESDVSSLDGRLTNAESDISEIQDVIPSEAGSDNELADKAFVNSTVNSLAAFYITKNAQGDPFETKAELNSATTFYSGGEVRVPTRNDYCLVSADESKDGYTTRYIYQNGWEFQFKVNETPLTAQQIAALNSGITSSNWYTKTSVETLIKNKVTSLAVMATFPSVTINGYLFNGYTAVWTADVSQPYWTIKKNGNNLTTEEAKGWLRRVTGSERLPVYNLERPQFECLVFNAPATISGVLKQDDFIFGKLQWNETELRVYLLKIFPAYKEKSFTFTYDDLSTENIEFVIK